MANKPMPSLLDREISSTSSDAFGHKHFAKALQDLIESPIHEPPFSIGLLGKWGTGKSSITALYVSSLKDDCTRDEEGRTRRQRFYTIRFNAWRYGGENIRRALLRQVYLDIGGDPSKLKDVLFNQIQRTSFERRSCRDILREVFERWGWSALVVSGVFVLIMLIAVYFLNWIASFINEWAFAATTAAVTYGVSRVLSYILDPKWLNVPLYSNVNRIEFPSSSVEEYEDLLLEELNNFKKTRNRHCERLVIFVDDLDRLPAEEMVAGLNAVRSFMEIPKEKLPEGLGIIFVISCDEDRVADALARAGEGGGAVGTVLNRSDARRFLDRIFQFRLEIPPFPKRDMRNFAMQKLIRGLPEIAEDLKQRGAPIDHIIDRMIHVGVQDPRNAIQLLNAFAQSWWLAVQREFEGSGTEVAGGLWQGAVTGDPVTLAILCTLRVDFPDFYSDLEKEPSLIQAFEEVFVQKRPLESQPETIQIMLRKYAEHGNASNGELELKAEYRPLRRYISSLEGHRWPRSLQPFLLLSQDPVARKFGDRVPLLRDALVSNDFEVVLAELGRDKDAKPLTLENVRILLDLVEELYSETETRRDNAAAVIARLANRLPHPSPQSELLLASLARRLVESRNLRCRVGVDKVREIVPRVTAEARRELAGKLIDDLLKLEGEIEFTLPSGQPPSLDEAINMVRAACSIVLEVRQKDGLDEQHDRVLLNWLEIRRVAVGGEDYELPFTDLEDWMAGHEDHLLPALGSRYTALLEERLAANETEDLDIQALVRRSRKVFTMLWEAGEESRPVLWQQLTGYVSARLPEAVALAWEFMGQHPKGPDPEALTSFITSFAGRLETAMQEEARELDWRAGGAALLGLVRERLDDVGEEAQQALTALALAWGRGEDSAELATQLLDLLLEINEERAGEVITDWTERILDDLPGPCAEWLGRHFLDKLDGDQQAQVIQSLDPIWQRDNITEEEAARYRAVLDNMSNETLKSGLVRAHLANLLRNIGARYGNPNNYLYVVFPAVLPLLKGSPPQAVGSMLHQLFANTRSNPALYGWLHRQMAPYWPSQRDELNPYNPQQIFNEGYEVIRQWPGNEGADGILESMCSMLQHSVVGEANTVRAAEAACYIWPFHRERALSAFEILNRAPGVSLVAGLMDGIDPADEDGTKALLQAWSRMAGVLVPEQRVSVTLSILEKQPKGTDDEPDLCLRLWLEAQGETRADLLKEVLLSEGLNDEQRLRCWRQVERIIPDLGKDFFVAVLPKILGLPEAPRTTGAVSQARQAISALFTSTTEKNELGKALLTAFLATTSLATKRGISMWIKEDVGSSALRYLPQLGTLTEEDLEILAQDFPKSKHLQRLGRAG